MDDDQDITFHTNFESLKFTKLATGRPGMPLRASLSNDSAMTEMIIAAILLFTNKAYIKPEETLAPKQYAERLK